MPPASTDRTQSLPRFPVHGLETALRDQMRSEAIVPPPHLFLDRREAPRQPRIPGPASLGTVPAQPIRRVYTAYGSPVHGLGWEGAEGLRAAIAHAQAVCQGEPGAEPFVTVREADAGFAWVVLTPEEVRHLAHSLACASPVRRSVYIALCYLRNRMSARAFRYPRFYVRGEPLLRLPTPEAFG